MRTHQAGFFIGVSVDLNVDKELEHWLPELEEAEFKGLESSILAEGVRDAIIVWKERDVIIDGHNRYRIATKHNIEFDVEYVSFLDVVSAKVWMIDNQRSRRNLPVTIKLELGFKRAELLAPKANANKGGWKGNQYTKPEEAESQKFDKQPIETVDTLKEAADYAGVSRYTAAKYKKILTSENEKVKEKVKSGEVSINKGYHEVKREEKRAQKVNDPLPPVNNARIMVGDAEHLDLGDETIDVIITSPPYNLGSESWPMGGEGRTERKSGVGYTDKRDEVEYQDWQIRCLIEWYRVAKPGASLFYNHKVRQKQGSIIHPMDWLRHENNPWVIRQEIVWDRTSTHNHSSTLFWPHDERIYWLTKGKPTLPLSSIGDSTVWRFHGPVPNTWHPAPFTEELPERCLKAVGRQGIIVLDPFGGSMTTCKVANRLGYESIGIDINPEYVKNCHE